MVSLVRKSRWPPNSLKFIYSEKATKFREIFTLLLTVCTVVKSKVKISQNFVAYSKYMNFNTLYLVHQISTTNPESMNPDLCFMNFFIHIFIHQKNVNNKLVLVWEKKFKFVLRISCRHSMSRDWWTSQQYQKW